MAVPRDSRDHIVRCQWQSDEADVRASRLQERQLDLDGVLGAMRVGVVGQEWKLSEQGRPSSESMGSVPSGFPTALGHDREGRSAAGVVRAEQMQHDGMSSRAINGAGDSTGIHVTRVRDQASEGGDGSVVGLR